LLDKDFPASNRDRFIILLEFPLGKWD
jgi:hypothetical protein